MVLLPGHGDISFAPTIGAGLGLGSLAGAALCSAVLDGDRRADVVVLLPDLSEGLRILQATGDGFAPPFGVKIGGADLIVAARSGNRRRRCDLVPYFLKILLMSLNDRLCVGVESVRNGSNRIVYSVSSVSLASRIQAAMLSGSDVPQ
ncbi:MAG: hypothetical protein R6X25_00615 [Candidatus Krumholzibacteriia bacterium]